MSAEYEKQLAVLVKTYDNGKGTVVDAFSSFEEAIENAERNFGPGESYHIYYKEFKE